MKAFLMMNAPILATYTDFRSYLEDYYLFRKEQTKTSLRPYSYSDFSAAADIKSPNYLKMIIAGERNLSSDMVKKFAKALKLNKEETKEFDILVSYGQAKDPIIRNQFLKQLSEIRAAKALEVGDIDAKTWEKVPNWLSWVLYAMVDQENVSFQPSQLRKILKGRASEPQIRQAMKSLTESGEVAFSESGEANKQNPMISNADKIPPALVRKLQAELIYLGLESLYRDHPADREISGFTLAMTKEEFQWVRHELRKVRKDLQSKLMVEREKAPGDQVYQVNVQLFPLTNSAQDKGAEESSDSRRPSSTQAET